MLWVRDEGQGEPVRLSLHGGEGEVVDHGDDEIVTSGDGGIPSVIQWSPLSR
jgi:hypothetical protein